MRKLLITFGMAIAALVLVGGRSSQKQDELRLREPKHLPAPARELLASRMKNHRRDMTSLTWAVVLLERKDAEDLAKAIADEPRLAQPRNGGGASDLNSMLPPRFFELQDELRAKALALSLAARESDVSAVARAYGQLAQTCVACHAVYLNENGQQ